MEVKQNMHGPLLRRLPVLAVISTALFFSLWTSPAGAWDRRRHRVVETQAALGLPDDVRRRLEPFLVDVRTLETGIDADRLRYRGGRCFGPSHFVNLDGGSYEKRRPARRGDAVRALVFLEDELRSMLPKSAEGARVSLALALWIHVAADVHQPLHCGYRCDRGGNDRVARLLGRKRKLHAVWDGRLLEALRRIRGDGRAGALTREGAEARFGAPIGVDLAYGRWADESARHVRSAYGCGKDGPCSICRSDPGEMQLDEPYVSATGPVLEAALFVAAARVRLGLEAIVRGRAPTAAEQRLRDYLRAQTGGASVRRCFESMVRRTVR